MDKNTLKLGFKKRNDHILQAAWLASFSQSIYKDRLRESPIFVYNIKAQKYLIEKCSNIMLSDNLIENHIDDNYAKVHEDKISSILKQKKFNNLGQYVEYIIKQYNVGNHKEHHIKELINFFILLDTRNTTILIDNAFKLKSNPFAYIREILNDTILKTHIESTIIDPLNIDEDLLSLFLSNCLFKIRFDRITNQLFNKGDDLIIRLVTIKERYSNELQENINGLMVVGESPVLKLNSFTDKENIELKELTAIYSDDYALVDRYWDEFSNTYLLPISWNQMAMICSKSFANSISQSDYNKLMESAIFLYEHHQIFGCKKELIINPILYNNNKLSLFINRLVKNVQKENVDFQKINLMFKKFKKTIK